jgi:GAF domain-containing protein
MNDLQATSWALLDLMDPAHAGETDIVKRLIGHGEHLVPAACAVALLAARGGSLSPVVPGNGQAGLREILDIEGPCLDAHRTGALVAAADLDEAAQRWSRFAPVARAAGLRAVFAVPLRWQGHVLGAVAFLRERGEFPIEVVSLAQALAGAAAAALAYRRAVETVGQLQTALTSRVIIEQAKGILTERWNTTPDSAFAILRAYARSHNTRLADIARSVVNHTLDADALRLSPARGGAGASAPPSLRRRPR